MRVVAAAAVTLERPPPVPPLGNLALDGDHSPLHQVGLLTILTPRLVPRCCLHVEFLLDLCSFHFPLSIFSLFPAILSVPSLSICAPFVGFVPRPQGKEGYPACQSCPKPPFALLLHSVVASSGLLLPACPGPAFQGPLATSTSACPLASGQPASQLTPGTGCFTR